MCFQPVAGVLLSLQEETCATGRRSEKIGLTVGETA